MKIFKRTQKRILEDNRGSAIVVVVIALAFIGVLGITIMWMSMSNYRMKSSDQLNKQGFYTAETVMEEIRIGLQDDVSKASESAYSIVMQNYSTWTEEKREVEFQKEFKKSLVRLIEDASNPGKYDIAHLRSYIDQGLGIRIVSDPPIAGSPRRYLTGTGVITNVADDACIVLKDVSLEFTDDKGFYSEIKTDFMIEAPAASFMDTSSLPPVFLYSLVADEGIRVTETPANINGSVYAGSDGIVTDQDLSISGITKDDYIVSKGPVVVEYGSETMSVSSNCMYAEDIKVRNANFKVDSDTRVADDLTLVGDTPKVSFKGKYTGFGKSITNSSESSAILINGLGGNVDMKGLDNVIVAGHSFIGTAQASNYDDTSIATGWSEIDSDANNNKDVLMGDSVSVKGNQLAYLVPDECIGVYKGKTVVGKNPISYGEFASLLYNSDYYDLTENKWTSDFKMIDINQEISALGNLALNRYIGNGETSDKIQWIFAPSNGDTYIYFYIKFPDSDTANKFARAYYDNSTEKMKAYTKVYANKIDFPIDKTKINSEGGVMLRNADSVSRNDASPLTDDQKTTCDNYANTYTSLCVNLTEKYSTLSDLDKARSLSNNIVFENIIDETKFSEFTGVITTGDENAIITNADTPFDTWDYDADGNKVHVTKVGYVYDSGDTKDKIIISEHDVYLKADFEGLIITKGKIYVGADVSVSSIGDDAAKREQMINILQQSEPSTGIRPIEYFKGGESYIGAFVNGEGGSSVDLDKSVNYQNWVKR